VCLSFQPLLRDQTEASSYSGNKRTVFGRQPLQGKKKIKKFCQAVEEIL